MKKGVALILIPFFFTYLIMTSNAAISPSPTIKVYLEKDGSLGIQNVIETKNITFLVKSGILNSSSSVISDSPRGGYFIFNSSTVGTSQINFNGLRVRITKDGVAYPNYLDSGYSFSISAKSKYVISWEWAIFDPFDYYTQSGIGLCGILLVCFGAFWTARKFREGFDGVNTVFSMGIGGVICLIGLCLMVVWLW